jgi:Na+-translocating ferredoxin:NAD+ oxidoreductase RnfG subunit
MSAEPHNTEMQEKVRFPVGPIVVLAVICLTSGLALSVIYQKLKGPIAAKKKEAFNAGLAVVLGESDSYPVVNADSPVIEQVFVAESDEELLYAAEGRSKGYQSTIRVLVSVRVPKPDGFQLDAAVTFPSASETLTIHRITVVESGETPGLGENIKLVQKDVSLWAKLGGAEEQVGKRPAFQVKFDGRSVEALDAVDAVTGATITSNAVKAAVRDAVERIRKNTAR